MEPVGPLMIEHRLIERMVPVMNRERDRLADGGEPDPGLIDVIADFFRTYADRTHHGKEEDILFDALGDKPISDEHQSTMEDLLADHVHGRDCIKRLLAAKDDAVGGSSEAVHTMTGVLDELIELYPRHIETEDKHFFIPCLDYFTEDERQEMLDEMWEFDRSFIHDVYNEAVADLEGGD
ncbi:MAG: hemerythrin domain-containing protein [Planctomycetota bacterium]